MRKRFTKTARKSARPVIAKRNLRNLRSVSASNRVRRGRKVMAAKDTDQLRDELLELINDMDDRDAIYIWNEYCREINDDISEIYSIDDFDEMNEGQSPLDIARSIFYGDFRPVDDFFGFNGYGNYVSFNSLSDKNARYYPEDLVDYIIDNDEAFGDDDIRELLDSANEDDEDEE